MTRVLMLPALILTTAAAVPAQQQADSLTNIAGTQYATRVRADTQYSAEYAADGVTDGSLDRGSSCWYSRDKTPLPCALTFELAQAEDLRSLVLYQAAWNGNMYHTKQFAIEVSDDGDKWRRVAKGELPDRNAARVEVPLGSVRTRLLRIVVLTSYNSFQTCGLAEVELLAAGLPGFSSAAYELNGAPATRIASHRGLALVAAQEGPQMAVTDHPQSLLTALKPDETACAVVDIDQVGDGCTLSARAGLAYGERARVSLAVEAGPAARRTLTTRTGLRLSVRLDRPCRVRLTTQATNAEAGVTWTNVQLSAKGRQFAVPLRPTPTPVGDGAPPVMPDPRPPIQEALIEFDWRLNDGIDTPRSPRTYAQAIENTLERGDDLLRDLSQSGIDVQAQAAQWATMRQEQERLAARDEADERAQEDLWRRLHRLRRKIALSNPLAKVGPLVFAKQVPGVFSHQLTQYYGRYARPGGGVFILPRPGESMACRSLTQGKLPAGSYMHPEVSHAADRILFSFCEVDSAPADTRYGHKGRYYHLYEMSADGSGLKQLTDGPFDDFAPKYMPDGRLLLVSTRRLGWHRCGNPGCQNYTLTTADADGSNLRTISRHETQEWDPAFLHDGRIAYTRWDYVDRNAVFFEQLWTTAPDGTRPAAFYGNNTFNPVGIWEPRPVPDSRRVMATAAAHHAMTAGSIILVDVAAGVDGPDPITRLTPDAPFPESETRLEPVWHSAKGKLRSTPENDRWPGHCYRSPYPLSERYFLAAYSYDGLMGEPNGNTPNMFGLYLVDAFGNRELLYRDVAISSVWPVPLRPRPRPPVLTSVLEADELAHGAFMLQNVYDSDPALPAESVRWLRILQVLPKSTPNIDQPPVGHARGAPGKQVLGTVPVEADGSAHFKAPAGIPLAFQALDSRGQAVQTMRSLTYLQPGEITSCVGCHEPRNATPRVRPAQASRRPASTIAPGPDGSKPFSYPILVQPVLDRACIKCHGGAKPAAKIALTGEPAGHYTASYNALAPRVPVSDQGSLDAISIPRRYGARGSKLMAMLLKGHKDVQLTAREIERLATWMDANALFYGTFDPADQAAQQRGERIAGPKLE